MQVKDILEIIDSIAPFDSQEEWDNSGLLVGDPHQQVDGVLFALDVSETVIDEALAAHAQLIVTHHPLMFSPRKKMTSEDYEGRLIRRLIRSGLSHIAAHTNLDKAPGGVSETLAAVCGLEHIQGDGFFRFGDLPQAMAAGSFAGQTAQRLGDTVRLMGPADTVVRRVGVCSGGGSDFWEKAAASGCDAFLSGEIRHHHALSLADARIIGLECGHSATERPGILALADALQISADRLKCRIRIVKSAQHGYAFPPEP